MGDQNKREQTNAAANNPKAENAVVKKAEAKERGSENSEKLTF